VGRTENLDYLQRSVLATRRSHNERAWLCGQWEGKGQEKENPGRFSAIQHRTFVQSRYRCVPQTLYQISPSSVAPVTRRNRAATSCSPAGFPLSPKACPTPPVLFLWPSNRVPQSSACAAPGLACITSLRTPACFACKRCLQLPAFNPQSGSLIDGMTDRFDGGDGGVYAHMIRLLGGGGSFNLHAV
jgi:hypothetical protein